MAASAPSGTKMSDTNAIGRMIALATAGAASALWMIVVTARPRAEKAATPTRKVTTRAGSLAASISVPKKATPTTIMIATPTAAMTTAAPR